MEETETPERKSLRERSAELSEAERKTTAKRWLQRAGKPVTDDAVAALMPHVMAVGSANPLELIAVRYIREDRPIDVKAIVAEVKEQREQNEKLLAEQTTAVSAFVHETWVTTGAGPTWGQVNKHMEWTHGFGSWAIATLQKQGVLTSTNEPNSLRVTGGAPV